MVNEPSALVGQVTQYGLRHLGLVTEVGSCCLILNYTRFYHIQVWALPSH